MSSPAIATYLLDSNHGSKLLDRDHPLWDRVRAAADHGNTLLLPLPVVAEIQYGVEATPDPVLRARRQSNLETLLGTIPSVAPTLEVALESGRMRGRLRRRGRQLEAIDAQLAAMAKLSNAVLVTDDADFEPLRGEIRLENWLR